MDPPEDEISSKRRKIVTSCLKLHELLQFDKVKNNVAIKYLRRLKASDSEPFKNNDCHLPEECVVQNREVNISCGSDTEIDSGSNTGGDCQKAVKRSLREIDDDSGREWIEEDFSNAGNSTNEFNSSWESIRCLECCSYESFASRINNVPVPEESKLPSCDYQNYDDMVKEAMTVKIVLEAHNIKNGFVGLAIASEVTLPSVMMGIMQSGCGFFPLDYKKSFNDSNSARGILQIRWIIAEQQYCLASGVQSSVKYFHPIETVGTCYLIRLQQEEELSSPRKIFPSFKYAYAIRTSGTTGNRRVVLVPHNAIVTNVLDFIGEFKITSTDQILAIAPSTFDPSIIDLFTSIGTGATITYVTDAIRLEPSELAKVILQERITIVQSTPSFLKRFGIPILKNILGPGSPVRVLALGGEKCVSKEFLRAVVPALSPVEIFNVYGVTEVSCWASLEKINLNTNDEICLGKPLSLIKLSVLPGGTEDESELVIGFRKSRACVVISEKYGTFIKPFKINDDRHFRYFQTGDLVSIVPFENELFEKYRFINRLDRVRKRNGIKIDLEALESIAMETNMFEDAWCVDWGQSIVLLLKLCVGKNDLNDICNKLYSHLKYRLYFDHYPDRIVYVNEDVPLSSNGKLDLKKILRRSSGSYSDKESQLIAKKSFKISHDQFQQIFSSLWNFSTRKMNTNDYSASDEDFFLSSGGTSISAMIFVEEFFNRIQKFGSQIHIENEKRLQCDLLSKTFKEIQDSFFKVLENFVRFDCDFASVELLSNEIKQEDCSTILKKERKEDEIDNFELSFPPKCRSLSIPIGLCVDATPVITSHPSEDHICIIGSHSGYVYAFCLPSLSKSFDPEMTRKQLDESDCLVWKKIFPGRIDSAPVVHSQYYTAYLGCHDGKLYKFSVVNGEIEWAFTSGCGEIRASPAMNPDGTAILFNTSNCVFSIDANSGTIYWKKYCDYYVVQTNPVVVSHHAVIFTTANGICVWKLTNGEEKWERSHKNIRTSPLLVPLSAGTNLIVFGDSTGSIFALNELDGTEIWKFNGNQQIPNNLVYHQCKLASCQRSLLFTTHKGGLYSLSPDDGGEQTFLDDGLLGNSRSKPVIVDIFNRTNERNRFCFCTSLDGQLFMSRLSLDDGRQKENFVKVVTFSQDSAESFSSPVFSIKFSILAVGARDNCIHFIKLEH
ncbi:unnamed protein product [Allacma fusca]|uniref:Uncharacterized protein n=1 Tax=Allacma fusca TaxID=39272 RepID=A0A8J2L8Z5_9HEXA|nr:unnamed protein product [Allacma fusca]